MDPLTPTAFSRLLDRWIAAEEGRSAASFARLLGIDRSMITRARAGTVRMDTARLAAACVIFGADRAEAIALYTEVGQALPPVLGGEEIGA